MHDPPWHEVTFFVTQAFRVAAAHHTTRPPPRPRLHGYKPETFRYDLLLPGYRTDRFACLNGVR
jgi:hypothetical protein